MEVYFDHFAEYPGWALKAAVHDVIHNHKFTSTPTVGELIEAMREVPEWKEIHRVKANASLLQIRLRRFGNEAPRYEYQNEPGSGATPSVKPVPRDQTEREADAQLAKDKAAVAADMATDGGFE
jgi:hypothetical protein